MNKYILKNPVEALLWCNNVGEMMNFMATVNADIKVNMNVKEHGYGVPNLTLVTPKGELTVRESKDYVVKGADGQVYVVSDKVFTENFVLSDNCAPRTLSEEEEPRVFHTQYHKEN